MRRACIELLLALMPAGEPPAIDGVYQVPAARVAALTWLQRRQARICAGAYGIRYRIVKGVI